MCGIVGCIGLKDPRKYIIDGLKTLDYRGYDSAGLAFLSDSISIYKEVGTVDKLDSIVPKDIFGNVAIGHTRWATHGVPTINNSHPHLSHLGEFALVHNGIIENYLEIKKDLINKGFTFKSDTDSEVIVNLIEYYFQINNDVLTSIKEVMKDIKGSYAINLIHKGEERIYVMKNASPLLIGFAKDFSLSSSDASPMIEYTDQFIELDDHEYGYISRNSYSLFDINGNKLDKKLTTKDAELIRHSLNGYEHFMLKEIEEIEPVIKRIESTYHKDNEYQFDKEMIKKLKESDHVIFLGCGTSYHASLVGGRYFEECGTPTATYIASEWAFHPMFPGKKPFIILLSQSGETADLIHCLKIIKARHYESLVITNSKGSTLDRSCTYSLLLNAGVEVSVASTKAYVAQVTALLLLVDAVFPGFMKKDALSEACRIISNIRISFKSNIKAIAETIKERNDIFYLGRGYDYYLSLEASLKLKEISYIHSEAIAGGELKHGPIALIEDGTPVIVFITDKETASSMRGNVEEVKSRGAKVYIISTKELMRNNDAIVIDDFDSYLSCIIVSSIAFYLAYFVAKLKGYNVDKPRNLAKSVTVE